MIFTHWKSAISIALLLENFYEYSLVVLRRICSGCLYTRYTVYISQYNLSVVFSSSFESKKKLHRLIQPLSE